MKRRLASLLTLLALLPATGPALSAPAEGLQTAEAAAPPAWQTSRSFTELGRPQDQLLLGIRNAEQVEFQLRRDRIATDARLMLDYTPSPALLPVLSHLRIYLNDELNADPAHQPGTAWPTGSPGYCAGSLSAR